MKEAGYSCLPRRLTGQLVKALDVSKQGVFTARVLLVGLHILAVKLDCFMRQHDDMMT
jgi:hypothetical protein